MTAKSTLSLNKRPCKLGKSLNGRTEMHGDEPTSACDITLKELALEREEIEALLGPDAHGKLFTLKRNSGMPNYPEVADFIKRSKTPFELDDKYEKSRVVLFIDDQEVALEQCVITKIKYEPVSGGLTKLSVQVQAHPEPDQQGRIWAKLDHEITARVRFGQLAEKGDDKQDELPMAGGGASGADDGDDDRATAH